MIIASEAPLFVPSSYSSSFAKTILHLGRTGQPLTGTDLTDGELRFHRVKGRQKIEEDVRVHC